MFPILNKYITNELRNSKYCPASLIQSELQGLNNNSKKINRNNNSNQNNRPRTINNNNKNQKHHDGE